MRLLKFLFSFSILIPLISPGMQMSHAQQIIYTKHAKEKMAERDITEQEVEKIISTGQRFLDTKYPDSVIYREKSKKSSTQLVVVTKPGDQPHKILVITLYNAETFGTKPQKRR